jgi:hypothetical protein
MGSNDFVPGSALPAHSRIVRTKNGGTFNPDLDIWLLAAGVEGGQLDFTELRPRVSSRVYHSYKALLVWLAENKSIRLVMKTARAFEIAIALAWKQQDQSPSVINEIDETLVLNYRALPDSGKTEGWPQLKKLLERWFEQGYPGVSQNTHELLKRLPATLGPANEYTAVATLCPYLGPFSSMERDAFDQAYNRAFADGALSEAEYVLLSLMHIFGVRPVQIALLKVKDVLRDTGSDGAPQYAIRIPSAKKRTKARTQFKTRMLTPDFGEFLYSYGQRIAERYSDRIMMPGECPLYPVTKVYRDWAPGFEYHHKGTGISNALLNMKDKVNCVSERTEELMNLAGIRFRYTLGTTLAEQGHSAAIIAEALDHASINHVKCYTAVTGKLHQRLDKAMALQLAPIAQAFVGVLVDRTFEDATLPTIRDIRVNGTYEPVGNCGKFGFCKYSAPLACYTCASFRPFRDAPHQALLEFLLAERERLLANSGQTMAVIEDRTIIAVAEVLRLCGDE